jgi:hypothetical protein
MLLFLVECKDSEESEGVRCWERVRSMNAR